MWKKIGVFSEIQKKRWKRHPFVIRISPKLGCHQDLGSKKK
jgi:hypothetical protein